MSTERKIPEVSRETLERAATTQKRRRPMIGRDIIELKIAELRMIAHNSAPNPYPRRAVSRARHQIYALEWVLQRHEDSGLDWMAHAIATLGAESRGLFPAIVQQLEQEDSANT